MATEVQFLLDQSDTLLAYEKRGLEAPFGQHPLMALISSMDRVQQLEVIYGEDGKGRKGRNQIGVLPQLLSCKPEQKWSLRDLKCTKITVSSFQVSMS